MERKLLSQLIQITLQRLRIYGLAFCEHSGCNAPSQEILLTGCEIGKGFFH